MSRVLVVEDEQELLKHIRSIFEHEYIAVDTASDGEKGSYLARTNDYDAIILDNRLPGKNGLDICKDIRAAGKTVPILILSVIAETMTKVSLLNTGADDYLQKPFAAEELVARVRALLRRPQKIQGEILQIDDLVLDSRRHAVKRGKTRIKLTPKEFMLLEYMMQNQGTVLSRSMILEHVWDTAVDPFTNTIDSHILSLRRKIGRSAKTNLIHTVTGKGYRMDLP
jgi:two-component system copper resistance phosphate regulon response regulator CusR